MVSPPCNSMGLNKIGQLAFSSVRSFSPVIFKGKAHDDPVPDAFSSVLFLFSSVPPQFPADRFSSFRLTFHPVSGVNGFASNRYYFIIKRHFLSKHPVLIIYSTCS